MRESLYEVRYMADENYKRAFVRAQSNEDAVRQVKERSEAEEHKIISVWRLGAI